MFSKFPMNLFKKPLVVDEAGFVTAMASTALAENQMLPLTLNNVKLILLRWQGKVYAVSRLCPHAAADLSGGDFYRGKLECPDHGYCFDVATGRVLWPEDEMVRLKQSPAKEDLGQIKVRLTP
jgi:nitrite reductase/ring-hydroxylating ferredoxin subunit